MKDVSAEKSLKKKAAERAVSFVRSGERVGLGTGSTTAFAIEELGRRTREEGLMIDCVVTSFQSLILARSFKLTIIPLQSVAEIDISIDGADEIDLNLNLIKGGGGAHTLEKIVHAMSKKFYVVADVSKKVEKLGNNFPVPVEILSQATNLVKKELLAMGATEAVLRMAERKDGPIITDNGNMIIDAKFEISEPEKLEKEINLIPGVVENGIFARSFVRPQFAIIAGSEGLEEIQGENFE